MKRALAAAALVGVLLSGCAASKSDYPASTAADLQERVLAVTQASADGDALTALLRLQELEAAAYAAAARSLISEARLASILSSIALVRSDLEKALSEAQLAELRKRLQELEQQQQPAAPDSGGESGSSNTEDRGDSDGGEKAQKEAAKRAQEERRKAEEEHKEADEEAREAAEERREAEEDQEETADNEVDDEDEEHHEEED